jgi:hypothetical protein
LSLSRYVLGEVRRSRKELQQALDQYSAAGALQKQLRDPELGWRILHGRGQDAEALGKETARSHAYKEAIQIIEDTRSQIAEEQVPRVAILKTDTKFMLL